MGTPYPSQEPGEYFPDESLDLIRPPKWLDVIIGEEMKNALFSAYRRGYQTGWANSAEQYLGEKDIPKTVRYLLERKQLPRAEIDRLTQSLRAILPPEHGGIKE